MLEKGLLAPDAVDRVVRRYEASTGPMIGARAVARAWRDEAYHTRLLKSRLPRWPISASATTGSSWWRTRPPSTTWSSARSAPVSVGRDGSPAHLVQGAGLPFRAVSAPRAVWRSSASVRVARARGARLGQLGRAPLHGHADAAAGRPGPRARTSWRPGSPAEALDRRRRGDPVRRPARADAMPRDGATSSSAPTAVRITWLAGRGPAVLLATGCCCGRTDKLPPRCPPSTIRDEWERRRLATSCTSPSADCLGRCALANVVSLLEIGERRWFHGY